MRFRREDKTDERFAIFKDESSIVDDYQDDIESLAETLYWRDIEQEPNETKAKVGVDGGYYVYDDRSARFNERLKSVIDLCIFTEQFEKRVQNISSRPAKASSTIFTMGDLVGEIVVYREGRDIPPVVRSSGPALLDRHGTYSGVSYTPGSASPAVNSRELDHQVLAAFSEFQKTEARKIETRFNALRMMSLNSQHAAFAIEKEIEYLIDNYIEPMDFMTMHHIIGKAKEFVEQEPAGLDERTRSLISGFDLHFDPETIRSDDIRLKELPDKIIDRYDEIEKRHLGSLLIGNPFVQLVDSFVRLQDLPKDLPVDTSNLHEIVDNIPEGRNRDYWKSRLSEIENYIPKIGVLMMYDQASAIYKLNDMIIHPAMKEYRNNPKTRIFTELTKAFPECYKLSRDNGPVDRKQVNEAMKERGRIYLGPRLDPMLVAVSYHMKAKWLGRNCPENPYPCLEPNDEIRKSYF